eukprot:1113436-Pelagomonas_calceolata.AAC.2
MQVIKVFVTVRFRFDAGWEEKKKKLHKQPPCINQGKEDTLVGKVSQAADQPESCAVGQILVTL